MNWGDIFLTPASFCSISSRRDVNTSVTIAGTDLSIGIISSNMDTVYSPTLAKETAKFGAISCVHRFCSIEENVRLFREGIYEDRKPWVSVGLGNNEFERAEALINAGAEVIVIDVANAACQAALDQFKRIQTIYNVKTVVGNFTTHEQIEEFIIRSGGFTPDAMKIGIGPGSVCTTQKYTVGMGLPPVQTVLSCRKSNIPLIFDGGFASPSDFNKALALGCHAVMIGRQFAGCIESNGQKYHYSELTNKYESIDNPDRKYPYSPNGSIVYNIPPSATHSYYRGSAAADSYKDQGKTASWRPVEGKSDMVPITGTVENMLLQYQAALRSAMTYANALSVEDFRGKCKWGIKNELDWNKVY